MLSPTRPTAPSAAPARASAPGAPGFDALLGAAELGDTAPTPRSPRWPPPGHDGGEPSAPGTASHSSDDRASAQPEMPPRSPPGEPALPRRRKEGASGNEEIAAPASETAEAGPDTDVTAAPPGEQAAAPSVASPAAVASVHRGDISAAPAGGTTGDIPPPPTPLLGASSEDDAAPAGASTPDPTAGREEIDGSAGPGSGGGVPAKVPDGDVMAAATRSEAGDTTSARTWRAAEAAEAAASDLVAQPLDDRSGAPSAAPVSPATPPSAAVEALSTPAPPTVAPLRGYAAPHPPPARQVAALVRTEADRPGGLVRTIVALRPEELGAVEISFDTAPDRPAQLQIRVERPETLQLLQRDRAVLETLLQGVASDGQAVGLSLDLSGSLAGGTPQDRRGQAAAGRSRVERGGPDLGEPDPTHHERLTASRRLINLSL